MKQTCFVICIFLAVASNLFGTELRDVIAHPEKFENHRITVVGVARVPGYFYLCSDEKVAADRHPETALQVRTTIKQTEYRELDRQWVEVTGVYSFETSNEWGSGPGILLERVRVLHDRPSPRIKDSTVWAIFKNDTSLPLEIENVPRVRPGVTGGFWLGSHEANEAQVSEGRADAFRLKGPSSLPLDKRKRGERIAIGEITFRSLRRGWQYSPELSPERTLYFRIVDNRIEEVAASEGRRWKVR